MKTSEWFICLKYCGFDILISQNEVKESTYAVMQEMSFMAQLNNMSEYRLDDIIAKIFNVRIDAKIIAEFEVNTSPPVIMRTGSIPSVVDIDLSSFKIFRGMLGDFLKQKGIIACRFYEKHIQYLIDINAMVMRQE